MPLGSMTPSAIPAAGREFVLVLTCPDHVGIVHAVSGALAEQGAIMRESQQFEDPMTGRFFMRVRFVGTGPDFDPEALRTSLAPVGERFSMTWAVHDRAAPTRTVIMVSKLGHCLNDLLYRWETGMLNIEPVAVVSNHETFADLVRGKGIPFHHVPVTASSKPYAEARLQEIIDEHDADLVVLARYMQILSDELCRRMSGRIINIHHSFLPGFKGAKPYLQAHRRGVKIIGATAHYVTADLDEGPIIEQEVARVHHAYSPADLEVAGRDVEAQVLARAVTWHTEHRVLLNETGTVVLR